MREKAQQVIAETLAKCAEKGLLPPFTGDVVIDAPKNPAHGDWSSNAAMVLAKPAGKPPREVAKLIVDNLVDPDGVVTRTEIAGPGFINLWMAPEVFLGALARVAQQGATYGHGTFGAGEKVMVEYVSANPTGPMHVGHGRGAVVGDAIAALLAATGHAVTREYYINDAGGQVKQLGKALWVRYREQCGLPLPRPNLPPPPAEPKTGEEKKAKKEYDEEMARLLPYPGEYLVEVAKQFKADHGEQYLDANEELQRTLFTDYATERLL
ncbi:MAG: arginine--tRNA ligase, partial [Myxococcales bacterium]